MPLHDCPHQEAKGQQSPLLPAFHLLHTLGLGGRDKDSLPSGFPPVQHPASSPRGPNRCIRHPSLSRRGPSAPHPEARAVSPLPPLQSLPRLCLEEAQGGPGRHRGLQAAREPPARRRPGSQHPGCAVGGRGPRARGPPLCQCLHTAAPAGGQEPTGSTAAAGPEPHGVPAPAAAPS